MKKILLPLLFLGLLLFPGKTFADTICQPIYGGGQTCVTTGNLIINKTVQNPQTGQFVDNLNINDPRFSPNQTVTFHLELRNSGGSNISQIVVKDVLPAEVSFLSGPGNFDSNSRTLTFLADNLAAGETRGGFTIQARVNDVSNCPVNQVTATGTNGQMSQDTSSFCVQRQGTTKGGLPVFPPPTVTTTPPTGPELTPLIGLLPAGLSGWFLRKKSGGKKI